MVLKFVKTPITTNFQNRNFVFYNELEFLL